MNARNLVLSVAVAAVFSVAPVEAQVLGGGLGGGLGGVASGGLRDVDVMANGTLNGSMESQFERGSLRRATRDSLDRTNAGVNDTVGRATRNARSKIEDTQATASSAASSAVNEVHATQLDSAAQVAGSAAADVASDGVDLAGAADGAVQHAAQPQLLPAEGPAAGVPHAAPTDGIAPSAPSVNAQTPLSDDLMSNTSGPLGEESQAPRDSLSSKLSAGGAFDGAANDNRLLENDASSEPVSSQASASGSGDASASKRGVSARGSAQGNGNANVAMNDR